MADRKDYPAKDPEHYGYESGLSRAVSSDARACASRWASAMEPLPRGNQAMPAARTRARNAMAVARLNRIPSTKSLSATARIAFCVAGLRCLIGRPGPISAEEARGLGLPMIVSPTSLRSSEVGSASDRWALRLVVS